VTSVVTAKRRLAKASIVMLTVLAGSVGSAEPQINNSNSNGPDLNSNTPGIERSRTSSDEEPFATRELQERQLKRLREEHQKQVFSDTATLLRLANQLKLEVDKSDTPGPDALKDVEEISRLAKRVSERIKTQ
jgi:hypothetical protein